MRNHKGHGWLSTSQYGVTIVELMISLTLGLLLIAAVSSAFLTSKKTYSTQDELSQMRERGNFALSVLSRTISMVGYTDFKNGTWPVGYQSSYAISNLGGADNATASNSTLGQLTTRTGAATTAFNSSDAIFVRYYGSSNSTTGQADNNILDCLGNAVPTIINNPDVDRAYSAFYIATGDDGEPALMCTTRQVSGAWTNGQPLVSGVESFQILYGIDLPNCSDNPDTTQSQVVVRRWLNAAQLNACVSSTPSNPNKFDRVRAVKISFTLRGLTNTVDAPDTNTYALFSTNDYTTASDRTSDTGVSYQPNSSYQYRPRKVFSTTIYFRNRIGSWVP